MYHRWESERLLIKEVVAYRSQTHLLVVQRNTGYLFASVIMLETAPRTTNDASLLYIPGRVEPSRRIRMNA
jgi:hypothetical protein